MAINDPLGDLLTRIRNGQKAGMQKVASPASKLRANVLEVLKREGYIRDYSMDASKPGGELTIENDPDHEAVDVAWGPLDALGKRLSFPNERRIAELAREVLTKYVSGS